MRTLFLSLGLALLPALVWADDAPQVQTPKPPKQELNRPSADDPKSEEPTFLTPSYFRRRFFTPPTTVQLKPPTRLEDFVVGGKIELSLKNYLDLVLGNNYDVTVQKVLVEVQRNAITRAFGIFDPAIFSRFASTRQNTPTTDALQGAATLNQLNQPFNLNYTQTLQSGTQVLANYTNTKLSTNNSFALFNPAFNNNLQFQINQPLLRGRGAYITKLPVTVARSRLKAAQFNAEDQIINLLVQAELAYWNVVEARENLRVQEQTLTLADTALKRSQRELELGAISSLEIFQPQANYANAEIFVTQARYRLAQAEDAVRRQVGLDLNPDLRKLPLVLTEGVSVPADLKLDREDIVRTALSKRPDFKSLQQNLDVDDLNIQSATNALRPDLGLNLNYSTFGRGGTAFQTQNIFGQRTIVGVIPGGFGDALSQLFGFGFPTYGFGVTLRLPLKDRVASANLADALVNKKLDALRVKSLEQNIRLQVLNAINQVENSKASVDLAKVARDLAQKRVDADQKRYELGTTTIFFVLASQNDLATAESNLVRESVNYKRNLLTLYQRTGQLLEERGIVIEK
jgi:outer membrane protein TolC